MLFQQDRSQSAEDRLAHSQSGLRKLGAVLLVLVLFTLNSRGSIKVYAALPGTQATVSVCPASETGSDSLITEYEIPSADSQPWGITASADGTLWFGAGNAQNIVSMTSEGIFTEYPFPEMHIAQYFFAQGPDGAMWFNDDWQNMIGRIAPDGTITEFPIPAGVQDTDDDGVAYTTSLPRGLVTGADGAIWFTEAFMNNIGRITTDGILTEYTLPTAGSTPVGVALGSDGAVWFVEKDGNQIGRITTDGEITEYPIPTPGSTPLRITAGPDDALWFSEINGNNIGRITTDGEITEYALPIGAGPVGITAGYGAIWFTEYKGNKIGCITTAGEITEYAIPTADSVPFSIVAGLDGAVWFTESASGKIGRLQVEPVTERTASVSSFHDEYVVAEWEISKPEDIVFGFDSVWVPSRRSPDVTTRIDPVSNTVITVITGTGHLAKSAVVTDDSVWIAGQSNDLAPIDPTTNTIGIMVPGNHPRIAYGFGSLWAIGHQGEPLDRVDPSTSTIIVSISLDGTVSDVGEENDILVTASAVWAITNGELIKIDPATNSISLRTTLDQVTTEAATNSTVPVGKGTDFLWWSVGEGLLRIDPDTGVGLTLLPNVSGSIVVTDDAIWVGGYNGQINQVNVATNQIDATYMLQPGITRIGIGFGSLWVAYNDLGLVQRLDVAP